ncbi:hypothetical protein [Crocinitomix catalasitica]|uniref:hypothetical protein n=1 Tax=Crocinitomix catalasitica TaxID=184607 RepID=UPI000487FA4B|nr:hypothetical protein [Crocinitomix catalasitica]
MILSTKCNLCGRELTQNYYVIDRVKLAQKYGDEIIFDCSSCGLEDEYHVDHIRAIRNERVYTIVNIVKWIYVGIMSVFFLLVLRNYLVFLFLATFTFIGAPLFILFKVQESFKEKRRYFNSIKLKGGGYSSTIKSPISKVRIASVSNTNSSLGGLRKVNKNALRSKRR